MPEYGDSIRPLFVRVLIPPSLKIAGPDEVTIRPLVAFVMEILVAVLFKLMPLSTPSITPLLVKVIFSVPSSISTAHSGVGKEFTITELEMEIVKLLSSNKSPPQGADGDRLGSQGADTARSAKTIHGITSPRISFSGDLKIFKIEGP